MTRLFLFGTLLDPALRAQVAGAEMPGRAARLPGARVARAAAGDWPVLVEDAGPGAEGLLVEAGAAALARLDFYEAVFGYRRGAIAVEVDGARVAAEVWRPMQGAAAAASDQPWDIAGWAAAHGERTRLAAAEILRRVGQEPPEAVALRLPIIRSRAQSALAARGWRRPALVGGSRGAADVEIVAHRFPYDGFFTTEEIVARFRRFDGGWSAPAQRVVYRVADAATVLPYDPVRDRVLLIEQVRFGAIGQGDAAPWLLEPVAGMIDAGESAEDTLRREAEEEAGLTLGALHFVARYYPSPGGVAQVLHSYLGIADLPDAAGGRTLGHPEEGEDILGHVVSYAEALRLLEAGDMVNAPLILTMQWLAQHRAHLRAAAGAA